MVNPKKLALEILKAEEMGRAVAREQKNIQQREARQAAAAKTQAEAERRTAIERDPSWLLPPTPEPRGIPSPTRPLPLPPTPPVPGVPGPELKEVTYHVRKRNYTIDGEFVVADFPGEGNMQELAIRANNGHFRVEVRIDDFAPIYNDDFDGFLADSDSIDSIYAQKRPSGDYRYWLALAPVSFVRHLRVVITTTGAVTFERIWFKADVKIPVV